MTDMTNKKIGQFIAELRKQKGLTQSDFARELHTTQSAIARLEKGGQNLTTDTLAKISHVLGREVIRLGGGTTNFEIEGGHKLSGKVKMRTSKNAAVALLMASLLNKGKTTLKNMPRIEEVKRVKEVLESIGVHIEWQENGDMVISSSKKLKLDNMNVEAAVKTRTIIMMLGPLIHEFKDFYLPEPGGCKLGERSVRPHFYAVEKFGVQITSLEDQYRVVRKKLSAADVVLYESGDTVTENALMAAARIPGKSVIKFASANYQVQDLCLFLKKLGVKISGIGTSTITVEGKENINEDVVYAPSEDPIEAMFFLAAAICTKSQIILEACPKDFLELELFKLEKMGFRYKVIREYKAKNGYTNLMDLETLPSELKALPDKIEARPYPGVNIDNLPFFVPIATQAEGQTLIHDWVYENRALYYLELNKLGAKIMLADPHRVYIKGKKELRAAEVICPPALRPAAIILIAMLAAKGTSMLRNVYSINRGYEDLSDRLQKLGAKIKIATNV